MERKPEDDFEWDLAALLYRNQDDKFFVETELHLNENEQVRPGGYWRRAAGGVPSLLPPAFC